LLIEMERKLSKLRPAGWGAAAHAFKLASEAAVLLTLLYLLWALLDAAGRLALRLP